MGRSPSFAGVILAAGDSTRMGQDKALLPWQGGTFLSAAIDVLKPVTELVIVVGGKNTNSLLPTIYQKGAFITENHHTELGQFSSLQVGLQEVLNRGRDTAIVALVDRPAPHLKTVQAIKRHFLESLQNGSWAGSARVRGKAWASVHCRTRDDRALFAGTAGSNRARCRARSAAAHFLPEGERSIGDRERGHS